jgi:hypothetical protein
MYAKQQNNPLRSMYRPQGSAMQDLLMIGFTLLFFALAIAYMIACDKLK